MRNSWPYCFAPLMSRCSGGPRVPRRFLCLPCAIRTDSQKPRFSCSFSFGSETWPWEGLQAGSCFPGVVSSFFGCLVRWKHAVHLIRWNLIAVLCQLGQDSTTVPVQGIIARTLGLGTESCMLFQLCQLIHFRAMFPWTPSSTTWPTAANPPTTSSPWPPNPPTMTAPTRPPMSWPPTMPTTLPLHHHGLLQPNTFLDTLRIYNPHWHPLHLNNPQLILLHRRSLHLRQLHTIFLHNSFHRHRPRRVPNRPLLTQLHRPLELGFKAERQPTYWRSSWRWRGTKIITCGDSCRSSWTWCITWSSTGRLFHRWATHSSTNFWHEMARLSFVLALS